MKEIELRLALVFYGGVSLAVYMHGVSREVLNLVRASAFRCQKTGRNGVSPVMDRPLTPTQRAYEKLLDRLGRDVDIRIVTDAIAGASAGGVNGIMLARSLAHDLPLEGHRSLWLENADVTRLAQPQSGLRGYLKSGISPVLDRMLTRRLNAVIKNDETRDKLRTLMQSRWFTPPFSGERYSGWMLDACAQADQDHVPGATLIPRGQMLDLFVTLTDYHGRAREFAINDRLNIEEVDHRLILNFQASHMVQGTVKSQFAPENAPELVFAARATSSFPGAFPPVQVEEMDQVLRARGQDWPHRATFLARGLEMGEDEVTRRSFVDGSVVMNKPFAPVLEAIRNRAATRQVIRHLVYVDPSPAKAGESIDLEQDKPGFFRTILASLAHIPRNEPVGDDLREIEASNHRGRRLSQTIRVADPVVEREVRRIMPWRSNVSAHDLTRYRAKANSAAHKQAGYAFLNYQSLKLYSVVSRLAELLFSFMQENGQNCRKSEIEAALSSHVDQMMAAGLAKGAPDAEGDLVQFLRGLDVDYRIRRLRVVLRKLNGFYQSAMDVPDGDDLDEARDRIDQFKSLLYAKIDTLSHRWKSAYYGVDLAFLSQRFQLALQSGDLQGELVDLLERLRGYMRLDALDQELDELFAGQGMEILPTDKWRELLQAYIGFAFYDMVAFPVFQTTDFAESGEIHVERISPNDAGSLQDERFRLKGAELNSFGAFFNRSWREHDYLWGRLNAADRLISIVLSVAGNKRPAKGEEQALRHAVFAAILEEERDHLMQDPSLVPDLEKRLAQEKSRTRSHSAGAGRQMDGIDDKYELEQPA